MTENITKNEWEKIKVKTEIPISVFFSFYKEKGGKLDDIRLFENILGYLITSGHAIEVGFGNVKIVSYETCIHNLFNYYDDKFKDVA